MAGYFTLQRFGVRKFLSKNKKTTQNKFDSLAPKTLNPENVKTYLEALNEGIDNEDVKNIALTGPFGCGKSSIIKTFEESAKRKYKILSISLAAFKGEDENGQAPSDTKSLDRLIELSVLQQIFYHVRPNKIPDSRFKRIRNLNLKRLILYSIGLTIWLMVIGLLFKFQFIEQSISLELEKDTIAIIKQVAFSIFLLGVSLIIGRVLRALNNAKFNKLNVQKGEIELNSNIDQSILNKHLDEILYFFERNKYNVIVIEDLDRFESPDIFTKFREINTLLNHSEQVKHKIVFIYAVKDDIFKGKDRTKFFDLIIPVIPVINLSNANEKLKERIRKINSTNQPEDQFMDDISLFIDDMRLLNNVCNEYLIYKDNLSDKLNQEKLLAMIVYKNARPDDFVDLHNGKGKVHKILNSKKKFVERLVEDIDNKIDAINEEISKIEQETIDDLYELRAIYIYAIHCLSNNNVVYVMVENQRVPVSLLNKKETFDSLVNSTFQLLNQQAININNNNYRISHLEEYTKSNLTFREREALILKKNNGKVDELQSELEELRSKKNKLTSYTLKQMFDEIDLAPQLDESYRQDKLMIFLIRNGYIDEQYYDYISYFHEISMTRNDHEFLQSVKSEVPNDFSYKLTNLDTLVKKIQLSYFGKESILNFDLVDFIFHDIVKYRPQGEEIIKLLSNEKKISIEFLDQYFQSENRVNSLVRHLCMKWEGFWIFIDQKTDYTQNKKNQYLLLIIQNADFDDIRRINKDAVLSNYIEGKYYFLSLVANEELKEKLKRVIQGLQIKFKVLVSPTPDTFQLFKFIYENNHYEINQENISIILNENYEDLSNKELNKCNYTVILKSGCNKLIEYVYNNINVYVENVILRLENNRFESEESVIELLNHERLNESSKEGVVKKLEVSISDLANIFNYNVMAWAVQHSKIAFTWNNVNVYYKSYEDEELDQNLINFLNQEKVYNTLSKSHLHELNESEAQVEEISMALALCDDLTTESYERLMGSTNHTWENLNFTNLSKEKVRFLVDSKFLNLSVGNYDKLNTHYPTEHINLLAKHFEKFVKSFHDYEVSNKDFKLLLSHQELSKSQKIQLIKKLNEEGIVLDRYLANVVCRILANSDYVPLYLYFLESVFEFSDSNDDRIKLFNLNVDRFADDKAQTLVSMLSDPYHKLLKSRKRSKIENNPTNLEFAKNLERKKIISSIKIVNGQIQINSKI